jgi:hypothetical protein
MRKFPVLKWPRLRLTVAMAAGLLCVAYFYFVITKKPLAPKAPVVSSCKKLEPGMKRVGGQYGIQFDIPEENFRIDEWAEDAPPGAETFGLRPKNVTSYLFIDFGPAMIQSNPKTRIGVPVPQALIDSSSSGGSTSISGHVEKRKILNDQGNPVGEDSWGYWNRGERWRRVYFREGLVVARYGAVNEKDAASYGSVHENDAELFDQVISSVCLLSPGARR